MLWRMNSVHLDVWEDVRAQVLACHLQLCDRLYCGPVLGFKFRFMAQPIRHRLLGEPAAQMDRYALSKSLLPSSDPHGNLNGRFWCGRPHAPDHTQAGLCFQQAGVLVTTQGGLYPCKSVAKKRKSGAPKPQTDFSKRVREAMRLREVQGEAELVRLIHAVAPGDELEEFRRKSLSQQMVNHVLNGEAERSYFTPFIAAALEVSAIWLGWGIGPREAAPLRYEDNGAVYAEPVQRGRRTSGLKS